MTSRLRSANLSPLRLIALCLHLSLAGTAVAQLPRGTPPFKVWEVDGEVKQIVVDPYGRVFTVSEYGCSVYDGERWHLATDVPSGTVVRTSSGRIIIGGSDVGEIKKAPDGSWCFESWSENGWIDPEIMAYDNAVFVSGNDLLIAIDYERLFYGTVALEGLTNLRSIALSKEDQLGMALRYGDDLFISTKVEGLCRLVGTELAPVPGGEALIGKFPAGLIRRGDAAYQVLLPERLGAPTTYSEAAKLVAFPDVLLGRDAPSYTVQHNFHEAGLPRGSYQGVITRHRGLGVVDRDGNLIWSCEDKHFGERTFMAAPVLDGEGGLWTSKRGRVFRVDFGCSIEVLDQRDGLPLANMTSIRRWNSKLYVGTDQGLFASNASKGDEFTLVDNLPIDSTMHLIDTGERLYASQVDGGYLYKQGSESLQLFDAQVLAYRLDDQRLLFCDMETVSVIDGSEVGAEPRELTLPLPMFGELVVESPHRVWASGGLDDGSYGLFRFDPLADELEFVQYQPDVLPNEYVFPELWGGRMTLFSGSGVYVYDPSGDEFVYNQALSHQMIDNDSPWHLPTASEGDDLWFGFLGHCVRREKDSYVVDRPLKACVDGNDAVQCYYFDSGLVWIGLEDRLLRYNPTTAIEPLQPNPILTAMSGETEESRFLFSSETKLQYAQNFVGFHFPLASHHGIGETEYRSQLVGLEEYTTSWSYSPRRDFPYLPAGDYWRTSTCRQGSTSG